MSWRPLAYDKRTRRQVGVANTTDFVVVLFSSLVDILIALSWYDLAIPRLGTTSVLHGLRHVKSVPEGK